MIDSNYMGAVYDDAESEKEFWMSILDVRCDPRYTSCMSRNDIKDVAYNEYAFKELREYYNTMKAPNIHVAAQALYSAYNKKYLQCISPDARYMFAVMQEAIETFICYAHQLEQSIAYMGY